MFDLETAIRRWKKDLRKHEVFEDGLIADMELHLREAHEDLKERGLEDAAAFDRAVAQLGDIAAIAGEYRKNRITAFNRRAPLRPGRFMPALVLNYAKTALRVIRRQKVFSLINISGLTIGLTVCMLIAMWVADELGFDRFHKNADRIHRVFRDESVTRAGSASALTSPPMAGALKADFPDVVKATRFGTWRKQLVSTGDRRFNELGFMHVDPDFFSMFSFPLRRGDPDTVFAEPYSVVLTESTAARYFGRENPLGKTLTVNNQFDVTVTGIAADAPSDSSLTFDFLAPFELLLRENFGEDIHENWGFNSFFTYVMLAPGAAAGDVNGKLKGYLKKHQPEDKDDLALQPLTAIHLHSDLGHDIRGRGDIKYVWIFGALAVFVLLIAMVNFMNLATARSATRAKEVGMRKVVGAGRSQLIRQFFAESILTALLALMASLILMELLLPYFNTLSGKTLLSPWRGQPGLLLGFLALALVTGLVSGTYPALYLSSFRPLRILRGIARPSGSSLFLRKALVIFQFSLSVFLIIGTLVVSRQLSYMKNLDLGFNQEHVVHLSLHGRLLEQYDAIRTRFLEHPDVLHVTASMALPTDIQSTPGTPEWEGKDPTARMEIKADFVDYDYIEAFDIPLVAGRSFSPEYADDMKSAFIVNEEAVHRMGLKPPVVGRKFGFWGIEGRIIGVMKDAHFQSLHQKIEPLVFKMYRPWLRRIYIKTRSTDTAATLRSLEATWNGMNPDYPFEYRFLEEDFDDLYRAEARLGIIFRSFTVLAVLIACLGLLGLASFVVVQRTREIGIRKVLGSSTSAIVGLLNRDFLKWTLLASILAWPAAYVVMRHWLQKFAYRNDLTPGTFVLAAAVALAVALVTVSLQSLKAARANPVDSLQRE